MTDRIHVGTMLIEDGINMPESLTVRSESFAAGWSCIRKSSSAQLGREIENVGWTFFFMAGEITTTGYGANDESRTERAARKLIDSVKLQNCNCLEITGLRRGSVFGASYTSLVAHARHIQKSRSFHDSSHVLPRIQPRRGEWLYDQTRPAASQALVTGEAVQAWENEGGSPAEKAPALARSSTRVAS